MKWGLLIAGFLLAVVPFHWTMTVNGLTLLGTLIALWGAGLLIRDDISDGL